MSWESGSLQVDSSGTDRFTYADSTDLANVDLTLVTGTVCGFDDEDRTELNTARSPQIRDNSLKVTGVFNEKPSVFERKVQELEAEVLERFLGQLIDSDGDTAYVTLTAPDGEEIQGQCELSRFKDAKVSMGDWFDCRTIKRGDVVSVEIERRERIPLSQKMLERMDAELDAGLDGLD